MDHPSTEEIEAYALATLETVPDDLSEGLVAIEIHVLWCHSCLESLQETTRYIEAIRSAAVQFPVEENNTTPEGRGSNVRFIRDSGHSTD